ncbi:MAG: quinone-dependent dihydroorotate dehydrogenase [Deltaproteobacteria bacterium]|nr:quinone-dependent dihydroorotate dehydrogenase [Deltaproteobacteria bacterium]
MALYPLIRPLLFSLEAEQAHRLVFALARAGGFIPGFHRAQAAFLRYDSPRLRTRVWGSDLTNPIGVAAGFDKDGLILPALFGLGAGFVEVGTVTPRPQPGNPSPRMFRLPEDHALINRMGFNNQGAYALGRRLGKRPPPAGLLGINLGKNRDTPLTAAAEDYLVAMHALYAHAGYLVVNISSPNTPGLRSLQEKHTLSQLISLLKGEREKLAEVTGRRVPLLVKLSPDMSLEAVGDVVETALEYGLDGLVAANTTTSREGLTSPHKVRDGGLSGKPLLPHTLRLVARLHRLAQGKLVIVGVGGVFSGEDAYAMIKAGASLVQLYTGLIYQGPGVIRRIKRDLDRALAADGLDSVEKAVGLEAHQVEKPG